MKRLSGYLGGIINFVYFLAVSALLVSCSQSDIVPVQQAKNAEQAAAQDQIKQVKIVHPDSTKRIETIIATGTVGPKQSSNIGPLVPGVITRIFVTVGDRVNKGDRLFQTRRDDYQRRVEEAKARLSMARARQTNALQKYERSKQLVEKGHTSQAQLDNVQTTLDVAKAEVQMRVAELKTANQNLTDTLVLAPFDAAITRRYNDEGVYLSTGARTGTGSAVLQLQENHIVVAVVRAPESALARLSVNMKALVYIQGQDEPRRSVVYAINDMLDIASRTIELRIGIENKGYAIKSGQFARAALIVGEVPVLTLPKAVIMNGVDGKFILVIRNGVAHKTHVEVQDEGLPTLVILQGVTASDSVILNERNLVSDGDRVRAGAN